jgi:hypothetical protein
MHPDESDRTARLRASDADRDRAASVLNEAMAEGRLTAEEHSDRIDSVYAAKTQADLVPLTEDLPARPYGSAVAPAAGATHPAERSRPIIAIFGGAVRKGTWRPPLTSKVVTVFGGADIDLRYAELPAKEITMNVVSVFGGVSLTIPPEMHVTDSGVAIFGGRDLTGETPESMRPDAPVLRLNGACVFGGISVNRKERKRKSLD